MDSYFSLDERKVLESLEIAPDIDKWSDEDYVQAEEKVGNLYTDAAQEYGIDSEKTMFYERLIDKIVAQ